MKHIKTDTIGESWLKASESIINNGSRTIYDGNEVILESLPLTIEILNPIDNDKLLNKYAKGEYIDFMVENFRNMNPISNWGYSYAQRLYDMNGINQIEQVIDLLKQRPNAKSATINLLKPSEDTIHKPCLTTIDFKLRDESLIVIGFFRSQDIGKKMYADALQLKHLGDVVAKELGITSVSVIHLISSAHIYKTDLEDIYNILTKESITFKRRLI